jgi:hypothetical protein
MDDCDCCVVVTIHVVMTILTYVVAIVMSTIAIIVVTMKVFGFREGIHIGTCIIIIIIVITGGRIGSIVQRTN